MNAVAAPEKLNEGKTGEFGGNIAKTGRPTQAAIEATLTTIIPEQQVSPLIFLIPNPQYPSNPIYKLVVLQLQAPSTINIQ